MRIALALAMAFATAASAFAPVVPTGIVHFYRYQLEYGKSMHPMISCDAFPLAKSQNGRVYTTKISVGRHNITTGENPIGIDVDVEEGKEYFIRIDYPVSKAYAVRETPVLVPAEQGREEIRKLKPLDGWMVEDATCGK